MYIKTVNGWRNLSHTLFCDNEPEGVFKAQTLEEVRAELAPRCRDFCILLSDGDLTFARPLYGAFGERL